MSDATTVAAELRRIALLLEVNGDNPFKARAFAAAARVVEGLGEGLAELVASDRLTTVDGLGAATARVVGELLAGERPAVLAELLERTPAGVEGMLDLAGLGPKKVRAIWRELGVESLGELEYACRENRLAELPGFGAKSQAAVLASLHFHAAARERLRVDQATAVAETLAAALRAAPGVARVEPAGELRRGAETVAELVLVVAAAAPASVAERVTSLLTDAVAAGRGDAVVWRGTYGGRCPVRVVAATPLGFAHTLLVETGSEAHLAELARLAAAVGVDVYGPDHGAPSEAQLYARLGCDWVPPVLREGLGEVELARQGRLPALVAATDLEGALHNHTTDSDGTATVEEMAAAAAALGWRYLGLADHSPVAIYAHGVDDQRLRAQWRRVEQWNAAHPELRLVRGLEADILGDGRLDLDEAWGDGLEYVVASVHSSFRLSRAAQTERLVRAVRHPRCRILGHPTGRLLLARPGYDVDLEAVLAACAETGVAVEVNASPYRLDLDWRWARRALELGVRLALNPDAHATAGLADLRWGLLVAQKAGATAADVVNCDLAGFLVRGRSASVGR